MFARLPLMQTRWTFLFHLTSNPHTSCPRPFFLLPATCPRCCYPIRIKVVVAKLLHHCDIVTSCSGHCSYVAAALHGRPVTALFCSCSTLEPNNMSQVHQYSPVLSIEVSNAKLRMPSVNQGLPLHHTQRCRLFLFLYHSPPAMQLVHLQVQSMMQQVYNYRSVSHAISSIVQQQGAKGLLKGYWATNSVWFPWNMIYIASYEKSRANLAHYLQVRC